MQQPEGAIVGSSGCYRSTTRSSRGGTTTALGPTPRIALTATPAWEALEEIIGGLEGGSSISFASGMAGIAAIFDQLPTGSVVALPDDCYQGVAGLAAAGQARGRWTLHRIDVADTARWVEMCGVADLIWLESPSNPLLTVADLDIICAAPRKPGAILGVDNTFATPLNQRPLALGADVAVQSVTKFIGGHSDLLGGVVTVRDANLLAALRQARELAAQHPAPSKRFSRSAGLGRWQCGWSGRSKTR